MTIKPHIKIERRFTPLSKAEWEERSRRLGALLLRGAIRLSIRDSPSPPLGAVGQENQPNGKEVEHERTGNQDRREAI